MPHDLVEQPRGRLQDVLAIVHDQQQLACPQILDHGRLDAEALLLLQPQSGRDGMGHRGAVVERREFADTHAVAEAVLLARCGLEGEPGLADAADPGQRDQRALAQGGGNAQHLVLAPDEAGRAPWQAGRRPANREYRRLRNTRWGFAVEDLLVHPAQRRAGIDAQLVDESFAHLPVGLEGVGLPAAAVLGEHQLPGQAFVERMGVQCRGELHEQLCVSSCAERDVVAVQCDGKPLGLQGGADVVHPRGVERGEGLATPQIECAVEQGYRVERVSGRPGLGRQVAETVQVDRQRVRRQHVAARLAGDHDVLGVRQQCPKPGKIARKRISGAVRRLVRPYPIDQLIDRDRTVHVDQQGDKHAPLAGMADFEPPAVKSSLDIAE